MTNQTSNPTPEQLNDPEGHKLVQAIHDRKELTGTLANTICNASNYPKRAQPHLLGSDMSHVINKTADTLLAAGYRKPRVIIDHYAEDGTDTLPAETFILSNGKPAIKMGDGTFMDEEGGTWDFWEIDLPITVIHTPEAAK